VILVAAAGAGLFTLVLWTGGLESPVTPIVPLWLFIAAWRLSPLASAVVIAATAGALALLGAGDGVSGSEIVLLVSVLFGGLVPAGLVRRWPARTVAIETPKPPPAAETHDPNSGATKRQELSRSLSELCLHTLARRAVFWEVDGDTGTARQFASSDGELSLVSAALLGDPMGWVWQHGISLRLTPTPSWAAPDGIVVALRVDRTLSSAGLVTLEFAAGSVPDLASLENSLGPIQRLVALQDEQNLISADRHRLELLVASLRRLPSRLDLSGFANGVLEDAVRLTGATGGALGIWVREEGRIVAVIGGDGGPPVGGTFEPLESEMALAARGAAMIVRESRSAGTDRVAVATPMDQWSRPPRCLAALPLATPETVVGVLVVWSSAVPRLDPATLELVRTLAPFAGWQLAHALEYGRVRERAERDGLTGLFNRRELEQALDAERARHERYGHPLALLLIDVDHFKGINDRFGHDAGDAVLRTVARVILAGVREVDMAARFGGEEFAVLLPETAPEAASDVAERLRAAVERIELPWNGQGIRVHISIGVSSCPACVRDPSALVRSADAALYQAKTLGRNRVIRAPASG
jgi:diguanylate cyclase (GGDEF)-like protein